VGTPNNKNRYLLEFVLTLADVSLILTPDFTENMTIQITQADQRHGYRLTRINRGDRYSPR